MNRERFSYIAHRDLKICNPIGESKVDRVIELLKLTQKDSAIDVGAGKCEFSIKLIEQFGLTVDAVDIASSFLNDGIGLAKGRIAPERLQIHAADAKEFLSNIKNKYALGACLGSTHALGGYKETLVGLKEIVKPGGYILIGEGYWKSKPTKEFLDFLGSTEDELSSHSANVLLAEEHGLTPLWATVANEDEWDTYEWSYSMAVETYALENPNDPDVDAYLNKIRKWREATLKWGRDAFGFGFYLFRNETEERLN